MKNVCVIGPKGSGKTVFLYLMALKLYTSSLDEIPLLEGYKRFSAHGLDPKIDSILDEKGWPKPTDPNLDNKRGNVEFHFEPNWIIKPSLVVNMPDVAGEIFMRLSQDNIKSHQKSIESIRNSQTFIILMDCEKIKNSEYRKFYIDFFNNLKEKIFCLVGSDRLKIPTLLVLNKSDLIHSDTDKKYGNSDEAEEFLIGNSDIIHSKIHSIFNETCIRYTWHSSINATKSVDGKMLPDYGGYKSVNGGIYTQSFLEIIRSI